MKRDLVTVVTTLTKRTSRREEGDRKWGTSLPFGPLPGISPRVDEDLLQKHNERCTYRGCSGVIEQRWPLILSR
ncbi:hypothetical protein CEXT_292001 [Caerostris extrusa]|uniref:Uncharacterized protein n=1 Tax=Caerostris extrusa TaxID=172846 RepID=A0AAV4TNT0_CAEEX|nr:hypothetical protein CEXT_292001 [Caerostris extrusa]